MWSHGGSPGILRPRRDAVLGAGLALLLLLPGAVSPVPQAKTISPSEWTIQLIGSNRAELEFPTGSKVTARAAITSPVTGVRWHIRLSRLPVAVAAQEMYSLRFQARADGVRTIGVSVLQTQPPWERLSPHHNIEVTPLWRTYRYRFLATMSEERAQIQFSVGASRHSVEISELSLIRLADGKDLVAEPGSLSEAGGGEPPPEPPSDASGSNPP